MKYNILSIPDIHWGAIDPDEQIKSLEYIPEIIKTFSKNNTPINLVVIAGDYFDSKLPLNSREAIYAIKWLHSLVQLCYELGVSKFRMFQGTLDHDNDQLDVFTSLKKQYNGDYFDIFMKTTIEETLDGMKCIYCPDETIETSEYEDIYLNEIIQVKDIGFFHGSFDVVYGELLATKPELLQRKNIIFRYSLWDKTILGPMISGHWHDGKQYDDLYYTGSPFRYKFNEDEPKGISFIQYDTEEKSYYYKKITNPLCASYITYDIYTNLVDDKSVYAKIVDDICKKLESFKETEYLNHKLRIVVHVVDDKPDNDVIISSLRQNFINEKNVKIVIKNKLKDKIKKEEMKRNKERQKTYDFVYDKNKEISEIIHDFILKSNKEMDIPLEFIENKIKSYIK